MLKKVTKDFYIIDVPLLEDKFSLYIGDKGFKRLSDILLKVDERVENDIYTYGFQHRNHIWLRDIKDKETLLHEMQHYFDYLFKAFNINRKNNEFRAYLFSNIMLSIIQLPTFKGSKK